MQHLFTRYICYLQHFSLGTLVNCSIYSLGTFFILMYIFTAFFSFTAPFFPVLKIHSSWATVSESHLRSVKISDMSESFVIWANCSQNERFAWKHSYFCRLLTVFAVFPFFMPKSKSLPSLSAQSIFLKSNGSDWTVQCTFSRTMYKILISNVFWKFDKFFYIFLNFVSVFVFPVFSLEPATPSGSQPSYPGKSLII